MTIDSPYNINKKGILSVTISYINDDGKKTITRTEAQVNKIARVAYDLYLILEFKEAVVSNFYADDGRSVLKASETDDYFYIGVPACNGEKQQEKLQKLLDKLLRFYK